MSDGFLGRVLRRLGLGRDESIEVLTATVRELVEAQRNQAAQLKRLVEAQKAQDHRWQDTLDRWKKEALESARKTEHDAARTDAKVQKGWQDTVASMQRKWQQELEALQRGDKNQRKWRIIFARQMDAMMRAVQLSRTPVVPARSSAPTAATPIWRRCWAFPRWRSTRCATPSMRSIENWPSGCFAR